MGKIPVSPLLLVRLTWVANLGVEKRLFFKKINRGVIVVNFDVKGFAKKN
jgi:hypothetical protein